MLLVLIAASSAMVFTYFGSVILFGRPPRGDFERYGMARFRVLVGSMQILGAVGVVVGLVVAPVGAAAAAGLTLMMLLGLATRWRLHDAPRLMVPAGTLAVLNATLVYLFLAS